MKTKNFPTFAVILLILAIVWILGDLGLLTVNIPWIPVIVGIMALGMIINHYTRK
tara:strand:- start:26 stop:190 length:165 start_codon:yes stop_codon:yes gene_type:complete